MKPRLPRKYKKQAKKTVGALTAVRIAQCALLSGMAMAQTSVIMAIPGNPAAVKALEIAQVTAGTAQKFSEILAQKPNHWRDFIKTSVEG